MSRFFAARSSGSEDESSDEAPIVAQKATSTVASRFVQTHRLYEWTISPFDR